MENGNRIDNPFYVRLKDQQDEKKNAPAMSDDTVPVLSMAPLEDSDSCMKENLPNSNDCKQIEATNEVCASDTDFSLVGKETVISDEGELLTLSSFPSVPNSLQPAREEESNEDVSADGQT